MHRIASGVLVVLFLLLMASWFYLPRWVHPPTKTDPAFEKEVAKLEKIASDKKKDSLKPFFFDPNTLSREKWLEMGFDEKKANGIINYRKNGGRFRSKEDFKKLRIITDFEYSQLAPFIRIGSDDARPDTARKERSAPPKPFPFNPNDIENLDWRQLGLKAYQYRNLVSYINAGGVFRVKGDLLKMYSIEEPDYERLYPYILLPEKDTAAKSAYQKPPGNAIAVEINSADSADLIRLSGIGPVFAKRIIRYRDRLGGFVDKRQLLEVFGMDTARYRRFAGQVEIDTRLVQKMDLNEVSFKTMLRHPYVEYYIVKSIYRYKDQQGNFDSVGELKNVPLVYDELYEKLKPYFTVVKTK